MTDVYDNNNERVGQTISPLTREGHDEIIVIQEQEEGKTELFIPLTLVVVNRPDVIRLAVGKAQVESGEALGIARETYRTGQFNMRLQDHAAALKKELEKIRALLRQRREEHEAQKAREANAVIAKPASSGTPMLERLAANPEIVEQRQLVWSHVRTMAAEDAHGKQVGHALDLTAQAGINAIERFKEVVDVAMQQNGADDPELAKVHKEFNVRIVKQTGDLLARNNETSAPALYGIAETDIRNDVPSSYTVIPPSPKPQAPPPPRTVIVQKPKIRPARGLSDLGKQKYVLEEE